MPMLGTAGLNDPAVNGSAMIATQQHSADLHDAALHDVGLALSAAALAPVAADALSQAMPESPADQAADLRAAVLRFERAARTESAPRTETAPRGVVRVEPASPVPARIDVAPHVRLGKPSAAWHGRRDAADASRRIADLAAIRPAPPRRAAVIAVASGKGGVGKTQIAVNLAVLLGKLGRRVVLVDADAGTANADLLVRTEPRHTLGDHLAGRCSAGQLPCPLAAGVRFVAGCSGSADAAERLFSNADRLGGWLAELDPAADVVVLDCGAGIGRAVREPAAAADLLLAVTTPEPTAVTDVYALIKTLYAERQPSRAAAARNDASGAPDARGLAGPRGVPVARPISPYSMHFGPAQPAASAVHAARTSGAMPELLMVVNQVSRRLEAQRVAARIFGVARRFLDLEFRSFAAVREDRRVRHALLRREPFVSAYPRCRAARDLLAVAQRLSQTLPRTS